MIEIAAPNVAAIDDAHGELAIARQEAGDRRQLLWCAHGVDVQPGHGQFAGESQAVLQGGEIRRQQHGLIDPRETRIRTTESLFPRLIQIQTQHGLIELHPGHAARSQARQQIRIDR